MGWNDPWASRFFTEREAPPPLSTRLCLLAVREKRLNVSPFVPGGQLITWPGAGMTPELPLSRDTDEKVLSMALSSASWAIQRSARHEKFSAAISWAF